MRKMINNINVAKENLKKHNFKCPQIPDYP